MHKNDYYPFGMQMPGRQYSHEGSYRYGFNGKEKSDEITHDDYDYGLRIYDARLGRFLSADPLSKAFPWNSSYAYAENDVIRSIDLEGGEKYIINRNFNAKGELESIVIQWYEDKDGNVRDNEAYNRNPKLKKADVYVIDNGPNGNAIHATKYQDVLTPEQKIVLDKFKIAKETPPKLDHFDAKIVEGKLEGNSFSDGIYQEAAIDLIQKVELKFEGGSDTYSNSKEAAKLNEVAKILKTFPRTKATVTGNAGYDVGTKDVPLGNTKEVLGYEKIPELRGKKINMGQLMKARAETAKKTLKDKGVANSRVATKTGTVYGNPSGRRVDVKITGVKL